MPVRLLGRLTLVLILDALALLALSALLSGFTLAGPLAALGLAAVLGIANAVVWPLILRFALPFTVATLGLGALVLNAAILLGAAALLDDVEIAGLTEAIVVVLGLTLITTLVGGVLALDRGDLWYRHIVRRQLKRAQLAEKTKVPGVVFLEIDGLAHDVLRRALRDGNAPVLAGWMRDRGYRLEGWETDWSSQTGACQAGLLHGSDDDMPAFRWWEKDTGRAIVTNHPRDAAEIERRRSDGKGLLYADGASRANILSGDAPHSMLTMSTVLDRKREGRLGQDYFAYFASPYGVARTLLRVIGEFFIERWSAVQQVRRDVRPRIKRDWKYALVRSYATVIQLDLQVAAVTADVLAGRPVVYTTFLAYDEVAHHSGIERPDTLAVLRKVDQAIDRIAAAVEHAPRPYELIVLSDHGQSQGATFRQRYGEGLEDIVGRFAGEGEVRAEDAHSDEGLASFNASVSEVATRDTPVGHAVRTAAGKRLDEAPDPSIPEVSVMASGNLGIISFPREPGRVTLEQIAERRPGLLDTLRGHPGIAFVLVRSEHLGPVVLGPAGQRFLNDDTVEGDDPLAPFGPFAADHIRRTDGFPHCPDIVVNSTYWDELEEVAAFEELVGSHGGMGGGQAHPFVMHPPELQWPSEPVVSSEAVHRILRGWLVELGQTAYAEEREPVTR
ncbi:phage holin family protein [Solirubrobacter ginsenosidimutans]|uniref:Phage holin family protein n=1 Tax=Solirubrobacter ginsenosidimutans TaxID=490573 RepID=A0A9X3MPK0_9ACTN|nr:phage holin family protein [Solirubrobacter ginsenosidimutans]MDA0160047.1 phage holin family protein [Solirubrobacter ginsenosidimutans]